MVRGGDSLGKVHDHISIQHVSVDSLYLLNLPRKT